MAHLWSSPSTWLDWAKNLFANESECPKPLITPSTLKLEKLEERLIPAVWGVSTGTAVTVQVTGNSDSQTQSGSLSGYKGESYFGTVGVYQDGSATNYSLDHGLDTATVVWGDGSSNVGTIVNLGSDTFGVEGTHAYSSVGTYHPTVEVIGGGATLLATDVEVNVAGTITATSPVSLTEMLSTSFNTTIAYFTDSDAADPASYFKSSISWGDGSTSPGGIVSEGGGTFGVTGTHDYSITNPTSINIYVTDTYTNQVSTITDSIRVEQVNVAISTYGGSAGEAASFSSLEDAHSLDLDTSPGTYQSDDASLVYNLEMLNGVPTIDVLMTINAVTDASPFEIQYYVEGTLEATSSYNTGSYTVGQVVTSTYTPTGSLAEEYGAFSWSAKLVDTDVPAWSGPTLSSTYDVDPSEAASPFGAGWSLSALNQFVVFRNYEVAGDPQMGVLRINGDGSWDFFTYSTTGATYTSPVGDFGTLTGSTSTGWTYTAPDHEITKYSNYTDSYGNIYGLETSWVSSDGYETITASYSGADIQTFRAMDGTVSSFIYSGTQISSIATGSRTETLTQNGSSGNYTLTQITDPDGRSESYGYNGNDQLTSDVQGSIVLGWTYSTLTGLMTSETVGSGSQAVTTTITSPASYRAFSGVGFSELTGHTSQTEVDAEGGTYQYTMDAKGNVLQQIDPDGGTFTWTYTSLGELGNADGLPYSYDTDGYILVGPNSINEMMSYVYEYTTGYHELISAVDGIGLTSYAYNSVGDVTTVTAGVGSSSQTKTTYTYYTTGADAGQVYQVYNTEGSLVTQYAYDSYQRMTQEIDYSSGTIGTTQDWSYDSNGNVSLWVDNNNVTTTYTNDAMGRVLSQVTAGETQSWSYNAAGEESEYIDANGYETTISYNSRGQEQSQISGVGTSASISVSYSFDTDGNQNGMTDGNGYSYSDNFNELTDVETQVDPLGNTTTLTDDILGRLIKAVNSLGGTSSYTYNNNDNYYSSPSWSKDPDGITTQYAYNSQYDLTTQSDALGISTFQYNALGLSSGEIDPRSITTSESYNDDGFLSSTTDGNGYVTDYYYNLQGEATLSVVDAGTTLAATTSMAYDGDGNMTLSIDALGYTTSNTYNALDELTKTVDGAGITSSYAYDGDGNVTLSVVGTATTSDVYDSQDRLIKSIDADGNTTSYGFDADNNTTLVVTGSGSVAQTTSYAYDADDRVTLTVQEGTVPITTSQAYDADSNMTLMVVGSGSDAMTTSYAYDADGYATLTVTGTGTSADTQSVQYDVHHNVTLSVESGAGTTPQTTSYGYNADDQLVKTVTGYGTTLAEATNFTLDSDGNTTSSIDAAGDTTSYTYDGQDRLIKTVSVVPTGSGNSTISQAYDANSDMTKYVDADGNTTTWSYNDDGQVTVQTAPIGNTTTSYNANGEQSMVIDADGGTISDVYDGNGNITTETWILGGTIQQTANYSYNSVGELTYAANSAGTYTYQYNSLGQKTQQVWTDANGDALTLNYTYDSSGNLTLETDSQGNTLSFVYNGEGLMTTEIATSSSGTVARTQWSYNAEQQITQIQDYTVASAGTAVLTINNSYDINGNLTTETETGSGVSVTYINSYDADNRITSEVRNGVTVTYGYNAESEVTSAGSQTNSFDANGNLTNSGFSTGTYNEINTDGTWSYYYDGVGNMVEKINLSSSVTWNYAYDMDYQLTSAVETNAGGTVLQSGSYIYDVFNNLVAETITVSGVATTSKFAYDGSQIYADLSGTGTVQTLYVTGMSDGRGQLYARIQSGTLYWIVQDRQGSVREIINSSGSSILDAITYTDDGGIQSQTGSTYLGNYGYTGLRYDSLTTYWVAVNRWYDPATDQWLEVDPDGYAGGLSDLRDYVGNDWTNQSDLSGLDERAVISVPYPYNRVKGRDYDFSPANPEQNKQAVFNIYASIFNACGSPNSNYLRIELNEGWALQHRAPRFGFFSLVEGSYKTSKGGQEQQKKQGDGGNQVYKDTDSVQVAVLWSNGTNPDLGHATNAVGPGVRSKGADWERSEPVLDNGRWLHGGFWDTPVPEGATNVRIVVVYTDGAYDTPAQTTANNGLGDIPIIIGSFSGKLDDDGKWNITTKPGDLTGYTATPILSNFKEGYEKAQRVLAQTGYQLVTRPSTLWNNKTMLPIFQGGRAQINEATKPIDEQKRINNNHDTGFDLVWRGTF